MAYVYILRGASGKYYIGSTNNLERRLSEHHHGGNHTTRRFGPRLELIVSKEFASIREARRFERILKLKKNPRLAVFALQAHS
jgi:putative endonuclease